MQSRAHHLSDGERKRRCTSSCSLEHTTSVMERERGDVCCHARRCVQKIILIMTHPLLYLLPNLYCIGGKNEEESEGEGELLNSNKINGASEHPDGVHGRRGLVIPEQHQQH